MLVKLKDIATLINGRAYLMPDLQRKGKYRIVRVGNFSGKDEWFYSDMELESDKYCEKGDLLYKWACNFGPEIWKEEKVIYHYHIWKLVVNENLVNKSYLFYKLLVMTPYWLCSTNGSTMVHITKEIMENKVIDLPDLYSQTKIARILKSIDDQIVRNNEMVNKLQVLGKAIYSKYVDFFDCTRLSLCSSITTGKEDANHSTNNGIYKFFTCSDDILQCDDYKFEGKSILVAGNGNFNVKYYDGKFNAYQRTYIIKNDVRTGSLYYSLLFNTEIFKKKANGFIVKFITIEMLNKISIPLFNKEINESLNIIIFQINSINTITDKLLYLKSKLLPLLINQQLS